MAVNSNINGNRFPSLMRREFEKIRTKLTELFIWQPSHFNKFASSSTSPNHDLISTSEEALNLSNCYYGYTSPSSFADHKQNSYYLNKSSSSSKEAVNMLTSLSSSSSSSSMLIDDNDSLINPAGVIFLNKKQSNRDYFSNCDTSSFNTNTIEPDENICSSNPFLNTKLTDLIEFNADLQLLASHFESSLDLIDDQDNFFNMEFMINYISYILLKQLAESPMLKQCRWSLKLNEKSDDKSHNLLKQIAKEIFLESEYEPCGLKGCRISIYLQTVDASLDNSDKQTVKVNNLLTQFRFDTSSSLTLFELNIVLKQDQLFNFNMEPNYQQHSQCNSSTSLSALTRRLFSPGLRNKNSKTDLALKPVLIDTDDYDLLKINLYE